MIRKNIASRWLIVVIIIFTLSFATASFIPSVSAEEQSADSMQGQHGTTIQVDGDTPIPSDPIIEEIEALLEAVGEYAFTAEVEQTLIPRPLPTNIGKSEERYDSQVSGDVVFPDFVALDLRFESNTNLPPIKLEQVGHDTYLIEGTERTLIENPLGAAMTSGSGDIIGYLHAAENLRQIENPNQPTFTIYAFDINGEAYADYIARSVKENLPASEQGKIISPSPILQGMTGTGELWIDADGVPRRQILNTNIPAINDLYDAKAETSITFGFDDELLNAAIAELETPASFVSALFDRPAASVSPIIQETPANPAETMTMMLTVILAIAIFLGLVWAIMSQKRWAKTTVPLAVALTILLTPVLTPFAYAAQHAARPVAVPLEEALGITDATEEELPADIEAQLDFAAADEPYVPELAPERQTQQVDTGTSENQCGSGDKVEDSDQDGLTDFVERCLGTALFSLDTDRDLLTDTLEVDGFLLNGQRWYSNPLESDSNQDGLSDSEEWPAPIGLASSHDIDSDGIPNIWDHDNDGDNIPDEIDFDPFVASSYQSSFSLESTLDEDDFDGYQFIEFQVQPSNPDQLRYTTTPLDWQNDTDGNYQDRDGSKEDVQLVPSLKIRTTTPPSEDVREDFGIGAINIDAPGYWAFEEGDRYDMYIILTPINNGGEIVAFEGRAVYGPDDLDAIDWESIELVWTATLQNDTLNEDDEIDSDEIIIAEYPGGDFRIAGMSVTKSGEGDFAIFGTPSSPDSNRDLFQLLFGLEGSYLAALSPDLDELISRFNNASTPIEETWGLSSDDVAAVKATKQTNNFDELIVESGAALNTFLNNNYAQTTDKMVSAVLATEYDAGYSTLEDVYDSSSTNLSFNLANIPESTFRTVNMVNFEYDGTGWSSLDQGEINQYLLERYTDFSDELASLQEFYHGLSEIDLFLIVMGYTTIWSFSNLNTMIRFDGVNLVPEFADDSSVYQVLSNDALDSIPDAASYLGESQELFIIEEGAFWEEENKSDRDWGGVRSSYSFAYSMYSLLSAGTYQTVKYGLTWAEDADFYGKIIEHIATKKVLGVKLVGSTDDAGRSFASILLRNKVMIGKVIKGVFVVIAIAATIYEIYTIWSARGEFSSIYDYEEDYATAYAITGTVLAVIFLLISFTVVGAVLVAA
ncbi:MAG: hypothetical protein AAF902_01670, partial [Chloroflexota bacterium]